jgi:hypothetical protein
MLYRSGSGITEPVGRNAALQALSLAGFLIPAGFSISFKDERFASHGASGHPVKHTLATSSLLGLVRGENWQPEVTRIHPNLLVPRLTEPLGHSQPRVSRPQRRGHRRSDGLMGVDEPCEMRRCIRHSPSHYIARNPIMWCGLPDLNQRKRQVIAPSPKNWG